MRGSYEQIYARSLRDPEGFWAEAAEDLTWDRRWDQVLDDARPPFYRWFAGGRLNTCYNAVDRHVDAGRGDQPAVIHDSPVTDSIRTLTFAELQDQAARFAGVLQRQGVGYGDRVIIYMPMVPEALVAMLGCARIGAIHSVVFGGFAAHELAARIDDARPKLLVSASCGIEVGRVIPYKPLLDGAIAHAAHKPEKCILLARPQARAAMTPGRDFDWDEAMAGARPVDCVPVAATDPLYILYTSGTTGQPKDARRLSDAMKESGGKTPALSGQTMLAGGKLMHELEQIRAGQMIGRDIRIAKIGAAPAEQSDAPNAVYAVKTSTSANDRLVLEIALHHE